MASLTLIGSALFVLGTCKCSIIPSQYHPQTILSDYGTHFKETPQAVKIIYVPVPVPCHQQSQKYHGQYSESNHHYHQQVAADSHLNHDQNHSHGSGISHQSLTIHHDQPEHANHGESHNTHEEGHKNHEESHKHDDHHKKNAYYKFEYSVNDQKTGDIKKQSEERKGDVVRGEYSLVEHDGNVRTVKYYADWKTGFHATVHNSKSSSLG